MLPLAGSIVDDGLFETDEEQKLRNESRKILGIPDLRGVRHLRAGAGLHRPLACRSTPSSRAPLTVARAQRAAGRRARASSSSEIPTPLQAAGRDPSYVGRLRQDPGVAGDRGLALFVSNDNLRKGAALNAVQIAELVAAAR